MDIIFTICSNNYLAQAKTLGNSILAHNPEAHFVIALVDKYDSKIDYDSYKPFEIIEVDRINIPNFDKFVQQYTITELNTSVKPYYIEYFFTTKQANKVIYFDPDIIVFSSLQPMFNMLDEDDMLLTPHFCSPPQDNRNPADIDMLRTGVYNLGFIAIKNTVEIINFNNWWKAKMINQGYANLEIGLFFDQLWVVFAPCFIEKVKIIRELGYNVANWNLHERNISLTNGIYYVNNIYQLVFFHFSNYKLDSPNTLAGYNNRFMLSDRVDVQDIFHQYRDELIRNNHTFLNRLTPYYVEVRNKILAEKAEKEKAEAQYILANQRQILKLIPTLKRIIKRIINLF